jgi:hypothetical protein
MPAKTKPAVVELPLEARVAQCINDFPAPKTTQDSLDQLGAEFATAHMLRSYAEKRYETVKARVSDEYEKEIVEVRSKAAELMVKTGTSVHGEDWSLNFSANRPRLITDVDELRTELVRVGINVDLIDAAINKVSKKATPALSITASRQAE